MADNGRELLEHELRDIYDAEKKLVRALESMSKKVKDPELSDGFRKHRVVTQGQAERLEKVFGILGRKPRREPCKGIDGLIQEFQGFVKEESPSKEVLNVFAAGAAQKVEAYEITAYKSLIELASGAGLDEAVDLFQQNLTEEQETLAELETAAKRLGGKLEFPES